MTVEGMSELFEKYQDGEYLEFDRVSNKLSKRADLHAFMIFDKLFPDEDSCILGGASHDEIAFSIKPRDFASVATEELIIDLIRCGVIFEDYNFIMHV